MYVVEFVELRLNKSLRALCEPSGMICIVEFMVFIKDRLDLSLNIALKQCRTECVESLSSIECIVQGMNDDRGIRNLH